MQKNITHIIEGCKQDDMRAQQELYRHCYPIMMKVCMRYAFGDMEEAGGIYNAAMLKVFRNIHQYRNEGAFEAWVRRIVVNICIDDCRRKTRFVVSEDNLSNEYLLPVLPEVYAKLSGNEIMKMVYELPKNTGLVFNLFTMEGYKHEEIAGILGISSGTSKWHLNEARRLLKQKIETLLKKENLANAI